MGFEDRQTDCTLLLVLNTIQTLRMTNSQFYLEHYLDSLETLPGELKRNFTKMQDMDRRNKDIMIQIDGASDEYLRKVRDLSPPKRKAEMEKIQQMFKKAKELSDDKVNIAVQTCELEDKQIRKLDSDLAKFESEMRIMEDYRTRRTRRRKKL